MKILFLIPSLRAGGAERVASLLCNNWANTGHEVILVTFDAPEHDFYKTTLGSNARYSIGSYVTHRNPLKKIYSNITRLFRTRNIISKQQPEIVISFMDMPNIIATLACLFTKIPVVISERIYPPYYNHYNLLDIIKRIIYRFCDAFVGQTKVVAKWAEEFLPVQKIFTIPNPINNQMSNISHVLQLTNARENIILAVGRLSRQKGFDMLIAAYHKFHQRYPDWRLLILGEGQERENLTSQIKESGLLDKVLLTGETRSPEVYYRSSKIFVLSSRVEGFPNALLEAMVYGLAVLSFDCKSGPSEIITNGVNGLLIPANDIDALAAAMEELIKNEELRKNLSKEAVRVSNKYDIEVISEEWMKVFRATVYKSKYVR